MLSPPLFHRIYRASAWYDLIVTLPFTTPLTLAGVWWVWGMIHSSAGLAPLPPLATYAVLFGNFFGTVVVLWSVLRLRLNDARLARYDAVARWLFSAWMLWALFHGASPLLWGFLVVELSFAILQSLPVTSSVPRAQSLS